MRSFLRHHLTYAMVVSIMAVVVALGGTAWAAIVVTGKNVKDGSLATRDIKNGSLVETAVGLTSRTALKVRGPKGYDGPKGDPGATGTQGTTGDQGTPARNAYAWAYNTQGSLLKDRTNSNGPPPDSDWSSQAGTGEWTNPDASWGGVLLELADGTNDGLLVLEWTSDLVATAHLVAWHNDPTVHSRLECRLRVINIATNAQATIGQPVIVSTDQPLHVITFGLVGGIRRDPGTYGIKAECRDLDLDATSYSKWTVAKGNLSVLSSRNWR